ncbi:hypothetical protein TNCV_967731 [Trichonephila clavipes]|nr:hypothetical protein TNCV_967731 [Trichonephila clavipes]
MHRSPTSEKQQVIVTVSVRSYGHVGQYRLHRPTRDSRTCSNKSGMLAIPAEVRTIHTMRSTTVTTGVSYTKPFQVAPEEQFQGIKVQEEWKSNNRYPVSNPPPGICSMEVVTHHN